MSAPSLVTDLVERFQRNHKSYRSDAYNEAQLRREFIDPFFKTLGWDMDNVQGYAEAYKDVIHEDSIKVGEDVKAPDYSFRVGGTRKFFLEAKKPKIFIKDDPKPAFQLRRYAWSAKLPLSILTNFEEFAIYDCRKRPHQKDKPADARIHYWTFEQYHEQWDTIAATFSKDAVLRGDFDRYAETAKGKRGTAEVDDEFLKEIEAWREALAHNMALRNPGLTVDELNFAVAKTIDRLVFLRVCEDRGIEPYEQLKALEKAKGIYAQLFEVFHRADERYNSGLFHFKKETGRTEGPDALTPQLAVDDKILKGIIKSLYYPESPYEFAVFPAEILGQVYEQFLGKVIRLTPAHQAKVEDKPEVKKAGGVYYTPSYIVDYIVQHTVGQLLEGKSLKEAAKLKIVDPACGSGSFLIGAYQYLLDWHLAAYLGAAEGSGGAGTLRSAMAVRGGESPDSPRLGEPAGHVKPRAAAKKISPRSRGDKTGVGALPLYQNARGEWRLTLAERKRILLNNIYGVDIDAQAVEVTKLSLLLKVLEGETQDTLQSELGLRLRALPDLSANIKCGNSLIGPDIDELQPDLSDDERRRINPFDWHAEFPHVFPPVHGGKQGGSDGGFDAVIGNPPYGALSDSYMIGYYRKFFDCALTSTDTYGLMMERGGTLLAANGLLGMIVQSGWVTAPSMIKLRQVFIDTFRPISVVTLPYDIFRAYVDTMIIIAAKLRSSDSMVSLPTLACDIVNFPIRYKISSVSDFEKYRRNTDAKSWLDNENLEFLIEADSSEAQLISKIKGIGAALGNVTDIQRGVTPFKLLDIPPKKSPRPAFNGTVRRYTIQNGDQKFIRYDDSLAEFKPERYFIGSRILLRELISRSLQLQAMLTDEDFITNKSMQSILIRDNHYSIKYFLGLINSRLLSWYFLHTSSIARRDDFPKIVLKQTRELPVPPIDFSDRQDKARHDGLVKLVEKMLKLQADVRTATLPGEETRLRREIAATDRRIDRAVYDLYGLTEDEIQIVEGTE